MKSKIKLVNEFDDDFVFDDETISREEKKKVEDEMIEPQFLYCGRMVNKRHFRAFVYGDEGQKLANSYSEYEKLVSSGIWFGTIDDLEKSKIKKNIKKKSPLRDIIPVGDVSSDHNLEVIEYGADR